MQQRQGMIRTVAASGVWLLAAGVAIAQPIFQAAPTYPLTGTTSDATALFALVDVGSQDGPLDGILDVVVAEQNQFATVLFGNGEPGHGDGTFSAAPNTALGRIPSAMVVADFDDDDIPDMLVGDFSNTVAFFRGTGSGSSTPFEPQGDPMPAGPGPVAIAAADVNGDGMLDAIVVDEGLDIGSVTVLLGHGDGTFTQFGEGFPAGAGSAAVAVADFNRDGRLDLAVANKQANTVTIMRGAGTGFFTTNGQPIDVGEEPIAIAAHDLNNDGRIDLVVTNRNSDNIAVTSGLANGSFGPVRFFISGSAGSAPTGLALADVNRDGAVDVLIPNNRSSDASVLLGDGGGNFAAPRSFVADQEPLAVAAADVNSDGVADMVCVNRGSQGPDAAVLISRGDGGFKAVEDVVAQPSPTGLVAGDVDNDGIADLILAHSPVASGGGMIFVYPAMPPLGFAAPSSLQAAGDAVAIGRGDFNGDGVLDVAVVNKSTKNVTVFLGRATGGFTAARNYAIGVGATAVTVGDWNRDGRSDLAVAEQGSSTTGAVEVLLAAPDGSLGIPNAYPVGLSPVSIDFGDFNEDGRLDLAVASNTGPFTCAGNGAMCRLDSECGNSGPCNASGDVTILMGSGGGTFQFLSRIANVRGPRAIVVADFDRDRHDDIALARAMDRNVAVYFGNGSGGFTLGPSLLAVDGSPAALAARDVNADSLPDVLVSDEVANTLVVFTSLGANRRFRQGDDPMVSRRPISVAAADFDGDGRYDTGVADNFVAGAVSVLTNIVPVSATAPAVRRGDGNGDARVTAADAVAVMRELGDGRDTRIEEVKSGGVFAAAPGIDANGDGIVTLQDSLAVAHRLFSGS